MKRYVIELTDDLSCIYEDIAWMNRKKMEDLMGLQAVGSQRMNEGWLLGIHRQRSGHTAPL